MMRVHSTPRSGATLTEVLMALLIMSVGVVSVFSLFPISILSSIKANQVTNGKIMADNVVELVRVKPALVLGAPYWQPNTMYRDKMVVCPNPESGTIFPDSNVYYVISGTSNQGTSGSTEPNWPTTGTVTDGSATWTAFTQSQFVVDEFAQANAILFPNSFGNDGSNPAGVTRVNLQNRLGLSTRDSSDFVLPDSWSVAFEAVPTGVSATSVTFPSTVSLADINSNYRVAIGSVDQKFWATRFVQNTSGQTMNLAGANLPASLNSAGEVGIARVEVQNARYSWFTTVNRTSNGTTRAQIVTVFNRNFNPDSEFAYDYSGLSTDRTQATVTWGTSDPNPLIREGNYVFDVGTNRWHTVIAPAETSGDTLIVEPPIEGTGTTGTLIFLPGVIGVYEL